MEKSTFNYESELLALGEVQDDKFQWIKVLLETWILPSNEEVQYFSVNVPKPLFKWFIDKLRFCFSISLMKIEEQWEKPLSIDGICQFLSERGGDWPDTPWNVKDLLLGIPTK